MTPARFAVGTAITPRRSSEAALLAKSLSWLIEERNDDGTWGGPDSLDVLISTNHVAMTLLAVGLPPDSELLRPALEFLSRIDTDRHVSFFWRSGPLLNLPDYADLVRSDMEYIWKNHRRIGAHKDYPIPFFLLKLVRFCDPPATVSFQTSDVVRWIRDEWDPQECWYGRTSITSMALPLIQDLRFKDKKAVVARSREFLLDRFTQQDGVGHFDDNLVDDCFTVYNLCETGFVQRPSTDRLEHAVSLVAERIRLAADPQGRWGSPPPFGGNVGEQIYPTAVAIRALMSYWCLDNPLLVNEIALALVEEQIASRRALETDEAVIRPFWGLVDLANDDMCFVLMPFTPDNLNDIYRQYVKPIVEEKTDLRCTRADDFYQGTLIMADIWSSINRAQLILADLTNKNPNVFYELGLAHTLGKRVVLMAQSLDDVPFDLRGVRTIIYQDSLRGYQALTEELGRYLDSLQ